MLLVLGVVAVAAGYLPEFFACAMSGILGVFTTGVLPEQESLERMVTSLEARGGESSTLWRGAGAALAVSRYEWELEASFSGPVLVLEEDACVVAADATLYHLADLRRRLRARGVVARGTTPSHLILAAYRAWGVGCTKWLEGDFAFILWDERERRLLAARDFSGRRPLYFAELGKTLVVGSTLGAVLAHPVCPEELNLPVIAATAGLLLSAAGEETCYQAIRAVPAAGDLSWRPDSGVESGWHWTPEPAAGVEGLGFERAAEELRLLLTDATCEQLDSVRPTSVWMSGGWDSTAVFGIGQGALREGGGGERLLPVSMSYPVGDPGREDETIEQIAEFWGVPVHWVESMTIPIFADAPAEWAAARDQPLAHIYEFWNRQLARGSRELGARVALDGCGGDQLFQVSDVFLADLMRTGRWLELAREWRIRRDRGRRHLLRNTFQPLVPAWLGRMVGPLPGGRTLHNPYGRPLPEWLAADFVKRHELVAREGRLGAPRRSPDYTSAEIRWYLTMPLMPHGVSAVSAFALREGVELRSPLYDRRIVEFALARPRRERASGRETKYLLRQAVRGLLPDQVLAPRRYRTGVTMGYSSRWMRKSYPALFEELFREPLVLAELGIIEPAVLRNSLRTYLDEGGEFRRVGLFHTIQVEWWLRSRLRPESSARATTSLAAAMAGIG